MNYHTYMAKLTLSVDESVVARAKRFAAKRGTSISRLVEEFLALLAGTNPNTEDLPPILARLRAGLKDASADPADYKKHLERKYR